MPRRAPNERLRQVRIHWYTGGSVLPGLAFLVVVVIPITAPPAAPRPDGSGQFGHRTFVQNDRRPNRVEDGPSRNQSRDSQGLFAQGIYDPSPSHLWNRVYRQFYVRKAWDGAEYGGDELDPLLWPETEYLQSGASHQQALKVLDEFLATHGERLISDPLKRAMLQRDLWAVFEWLCNTRYARRPEGKELERKLAQVIERLALTADQIQALPDTYSLAVASKAFPTEYNPIQPDAAFLPPNLIQPGSAWVNLGVDAEGGNAPMHSGAPAHSSFFSGRSVFLVFLRLPGGREATHAYLKQLADFPKPCIPNPSQFHRLTREAGMGPNSGPVPNPDLPQFPPGTEVLLVRRMMLIDRQGELRPTGLVESLQVRVFLRVPSRAEWLAERPESSRRLQDAFEFRLSRSRLFAGQSGGLRAITRDERELVQFMAHPFDSLETRPESGSSTTSAEQLERPILETCASCHEAPGVQSLASARTLFGRVACTGLKFYEGSPAEQAENTVDWKRQQYNWGLLEGLRRSGAGSD